MNRNELQRLASEWVRMAKNDIRNKIMDFLREVGATPRELAYHLAISEGELQQILEGNGEITISTFAKLLIATGNALEIKPIEETPMGDYENMPCEEELRHQGIPRPSVFGRMTPHRNPYGHFDRYAYNRQSHNVNDDIEIDDDDDEFVPPTPQIREEMNERINRNNHSEEQPRDSHGRFMPRHHADEAPRRATSSPFERMTIDELVNIIRERLWDSEINLATATKSQLVDFLNEKNKRMNEFKRMKSFEEDPKVIEFKNRIKRTFDNNPHLREWAKKFIGGLSED